MAEVSKRGHLQERFVVVMHGWQSEFTDGPLRWLELCFLEWLSGCSDHLTKLLDVVLCSAVKVIVVV